MICILNGQGATEIWDDHGYKKMFEWNNWSLFAPPLITVHRLVNDENFIFNCPYSFSDRFYGEEDYFEVETLC